LTAHARLTASHSIRAQRLLPPAAVLQDTPRGAKTCFGTLVVALPVPFSGGFLNLEHNGDKAFINWGQALSRQPYCMATKTYVAIPNCGLQWVAFFGDVMHAVDKVQSGMRLTLTYVLHREPPADPTADALLVRASVLHTKLLEALGDKKFMKEGGSLGFYCRCEGGGGRRVDGGGLLQDWMVPSTSRNVWLLAVAAAQTEVLLIKALGSCQHSLPAILWVHTRLQWVARRGGVLIALPPPPPHWPPTHTLTWLLQAPV
jgi:hypothetical protein